MAINIGGSVGRPIDLDSRKNYKNQSVNATVSKTTQDSVNITNQAHKLADIEKNSSLAFEVSQQKETNKIEALKQSIADGSYKVDATKLANNIFDFESDLNTIYG